MRGDNSHLEALLEEMGKAALALTNGMQPLFEHAAAAEGPAAATFAALQREFAERHAVLWHTMLARPPGETTEPVVAAQPGDRRFSAPQWAASPFHDYLRQAYLLNAEFATRMVDALPLGDARSKGRIAYMTRQMVEALAPSNFAATNPEFIQAALDSGGESITRGIANLLADLDKGRISMTDESAFEVGGNLALTPGAVIHENAVMQLIQYAPLTARVASRPLLIVPPCINKYYILDLTPHNSFVRFAVEQGFTVFMISWKNAGAAESALTWDDYVQIGVLEALDAARDIARVPDPNVLGFCIGGTLLASALAVDGARGGEVASLTLMTTLLDFEQAGELGCLVDESTIAAREQAAESGGLMKGGELAGVFASLRANDLIWQYVVGNYLKGTTPQPFDLLYWNTDSTNLPGPFMTWYLRNMYLDNALREPGRLRMLNEPVDLGRIKAPAYLLATAEDHIVPWQGAYASRVLLGGDTTFVLGASGHIAGAINPASRNRRSYRTSPHQGPEPEGWLASSVEHAGSWWLHWAEWLKGYGGRSVAAKKKPGNARFKVIEPAPGRYVKERA